MGGRDQSLLFRHSHWDRDQHHPRGQFKFGQRIHGAVFSGARGVHGGGSLSWKCLKLGGEVSLRVDARVDGERPLVDSQVALVDRGHGGQCGGVGA